MRQLPWPTMATRLRDFGRCAAAVRTEVVCSTGGEHRRADQTVTGARISPQERARARISPQASAAAAPARDNAEGRVPRRWAGGRAPAQRPGAPPTRPKQVPVDDADVAELLAAVSATARSGGFPSLASARGRAAEVNYLRVAVVARRPGQGRPGAAGDGDGRAAAVGNFLFFY
jgi:hypothetical protein